MKQKQRKGKVFSETDEQRWERTAALFENEEEFKKIAGSSRVINASEQRALFGPGKTKQISIRLPEADLDAVKEIAHISDRPYQQLVVVAIQQYIDRIAKRSKSPIDG